MVEAIPGDSKGGSAAAAAAAAGDDGNDGDPQDVNTGPKHEKLADDGGQGVALMENKFTRNLTSPFIN